MIMAKILGILPSKYNASISAWDSVDATEQTLPCLRERLLREEARMTSMDEVSSALATSSISKEKKRSRRPCDNRRTNTTYLRVRKRLFVTFVKKTGHIAKYCFARKRASKASEKNDDSKDKSDSKCNESANPTAFVVYDAAKEVRNKASAREINSQITVISELDEKYIWLLDSGASRHLCCQKDWFINLAPCNNEYVCLGDNTSLKVEGRGKISISRLIDDKWMDGEINDVLYVPCLKKN